MQNLFGNNNGQNRNMDLLNNPTFLAGLAMMRGAAPHNALMEAASANQQYTQNELQQNEFRRKQYLAAILPDVIKNLSPNPQEALSTLTQVGVPPQEGALILERMGIGGRRNLSTGISAPELKANIQTINNLEKQAQFAERELRLLEDSEEAFKDFDKNTGSWTGAGSVVSKTLSMLPKAAENIAFNKKAQTAKQEIDKLNSQLFQNRVVGLGSRATDTAKEQIIKGLPTTDLNPEARKDVLQTKKRENYEQIVRARFFKEWANTYNRDLSEATKAFDQYLEQIPLLKENGEINKDAVKSIPAFLSGGMPVKASEKPTMDFNNVSLEALLAEREARKGRR